MYFLHLVPPPPPHYTIMVKGLLKHPQQVTGAGQILVTKYNGGLVTN